MNRRRFLAVGAGSAALLAAGGWWWSTQRGQPKRAALQTPAARVLITALIPAVVGQPGGKPLAGAELAAAADRMLATMAGLPLSAQDELGELFGLLDNSAFRRLAAGISTPWEQATPEALAQFLQSWRTHSLSLLQVGYHALHDLAAGSFYADPSTWGPTGYPGPHIQFS